MPDMKRRAIAFALLSAAGASAAVALKPRSRASEMLAHIDLEKQIPLAFDGWQIDKTIVPILPNPEVQAKLDAIYTQVLARTYINRRGERVMLSIAYGADQASDATAVHRPEFCYSAQGFAVKQLGDAQVPLPQGAVVVRRLQGSLGTREEPISYWITLNDRAMLPGVGRKLEQIRQGLLGRIPDGMLVRVSNITGDQAAGFALQDQFIGSLEKSLDASVRDRYFGKLLT